MEVHFFVPLWEHAPYGHWSRMYNPDHPGNPYFRDLFEDGDRT